MSYFHFKNARIHYIKDGAGPKVMLTFHGFGQSCESFLPLSRSLEQDFTFYHFDVFFHGKSTWVDVNRPPDQPFWQQLTDSFLAQENIGRFGLIGFSIGARLALATFMGQRNRVTDLILIAPDGIRINGWFLLATYPWFVRKYFRYLVSRPDSFFFLLKVLLKLKLVNKSVIRLAESQMVARNKRLQVYNCWLTLRKLRIKRRKLIQQLHNDLNITVVAGEKDGIIKPGKLLSTFGKLKSVQFFVLDANHWRLLAKAIDKILEDRKSILPVLGSLIHFFLFLADNVKT